MIAVLKTIKIRWENSEIFILLTEDSGLSTNDSLNYDKDFVRMIVVIVVAFIVVYVLLKKWTNDLENMQWKKFSKIDEYTYDKEAVSSQNNCEEKDNSELNKEEGGSLQRDDCNKNEKCKFNKKSRKGHSSIDYSKSIDNINVVYSSLDLNEIESRGEVLNNLYKRVKYLRYHINSFNVLSTIFEAVLISCIFWGISLLDLDVGVYNFVTAFVAVFAIVVCMHSHIEINENNKPDQLVKEYELSLLNQKLDNYYKSFDSYKKIKWENQNEVKPSSEHNNLPQTNSSLTSGQPSEMLGSVTGSESDAASGQPSEMLGSESGGGPDAASGQPSEMLGSVTGSEPDATNGQPEEMKSSVNDDKLKDQTTKSISTNNTESDVKNANDEDGAKS